MRKYYTRISQVVYNIINMSLTVIAVISVIILVGFASDKLQSGSGNIYGYKPIIIETGSMAPEIKPKSVIVGKTVKSIDSLSEGDIVTYSLEEGGQLKMITHRIIDINYETERIKTKGDAVAVEDKFIGEDGLPFENVEYKIVKVLNWATPWIMLFREKPLNILILVILISALRYIWRHLDKLYYDKEFEFKPYNKKGQE